MHRLRGAGGAACEETEGSFDGDESGGSPIPEAAGSIERAAAEIRPGSCPPIPQSGGSGTREPSPPSTAAPRRSRAQADSDARRKPAPTDRNLFRPLEGLPISFSLAPGQSPKRKRAEPGASLTRLRTLAFACVVERRTSSLRRAWECNRSFETQRRTLSSPLERNFDSAAESLTSKIRRMTTLGDGLNNRR